MPDYAPNLLTVIPARNEAATVAEIVRRVRAAVGGDVLVVNDASDDDTSAQARKAGAVVLDLPLRLGAWGAAQTGLRYARRNRYAVALTLEPWTVENTLITPTLKLKRNNLQARFGAEIERLYRR